MSRSSSPFPDTPVIPTSYTVSAVTVDTESTDPLAAPERAKSVPSALTFPTFSSNVTRNVTVFAFVHSSGGLWRMIDVTVGGVESLPLH